MKYKKNILQLAAAPTISVPTGLGITDVIGGNPAVINGDLASNIERIISRGFIYAYAIAGIAIIAMVMRAGFLWITSGGESEAIEKAKKTIVRAIIGFILVAFSYVIGRFILNVTGFGDTSGGFNLFDFSAILDKF